MDADKKTYFPLLISVFSACEGCDDMLVVNTPEEIPNGVSFTVVKTNYKDKE